MVIPVLSTEIKADEGRKPTPLERFTRLLGNDVFFVPCAWGTKKPIVQYTKLSFADTKSPEYLARFKDRAVNIAVYLGKASGGLCTIDFDADDDLAAFLAENPTLAKTTRSRGSRGGMIWVRIIGDFPKSCHTNRFEWRADANLATIYGRHPKSMEYQLVCSDPPARVAFDDIRWPDGWDQPWEATADDRVQQRFGEPYYTNDKGTVTALNEAYWAGLYAEENVILYEPAEKEFYRYDDRTGAYEPVSADAIRRDLANRILEASRQTGVLDLQKKRTASTLNSIITQLRGQVEARHAFAADRHAIHLANGMVMFTGADADFHSFSPEYRSRNRSPITFDETAGCDRFLNELLNPAVHPEDVELLQKFAGMCLLGSNRAQRILILDGEGGRGKTQLANVFQGLVGRQNVTQLRTTFLGERFELYRFLSKTLLIGVDVESDFLSTKGASVLKGLVGGDWLDAEQKGGTGSFPLQGRFNVIITSNTRLRVRLHGDLSAWKRRLTIVRYESPPPVKKIPDFGAYLIRTEGSGILNWALKGAQKVLAEIPDTGGDLVMTARQRELVDSLLAESESLRHFLEDCVQRDVARDVTVNELVEAYAAYCPEKKWKPLPITEVQMSLESLMLELFGVTKRHDLQRNNKSQRGFSGVVLR